MIVKHKLKMELTGKEPTPYIDVVQHDQFSRIIILSLEENGLPARIPDDCRVVVRYRRGDDEEGAYDTIRGGENAWKIYDNVVEVILLPDVCKVAGTSVLTLELMENEEILFTFPLEVRVKGNRTVSKKTSDGGYLAGFVPQMTGARTGEFLCVAEVDDEGRVIQTKSAPIQEITGEAGASAYEVAVANGFRGSEKAWLESLVGPQGEQGSQGPRGTKGEKGDTGDKGDKGDIGETGPQGIAGKTAYQYAKDGGYNGTEAEFAQKLASETAGTHIGSEAPTDPTVNLWVDIGEEDTANPGGGSVSAAQSDWDAAEGQPGHVLNRTHYKGYETVFPETEVTFNADGMAELVIDGVINFEAGAEYSVNWNGTIYTAKASFMDGMVFFGDAAFGGAEPFTFIAMPADDTTTVLTAMSVEVDCTITVAIEKTVYARIPVEYLPETVKTYTVLVPEGEADTSKTNWELSISGDKAAETLYHGGRVFIELYTANGFIRTEITSCTFVAVPDEGWSKLLGECVYVKSVRTVAFANGTWMPPTA